MASVTLIKCLKCACHCLRLCNCLVNVFLLVRLSVLITLIERLKGHKCPGLLFDDQWLVLHHLLHTTKYMQLWTMHVLYFWKALGTGMSEMMFPGVWHANSQTQIHKYSVYTRANSRPIESDPLWTMHVLYAICLLYTEAAKMQS